MNNRAERIAKVAAALSKAEGWHGPEIDWNVLATAAVDALEGE